MIQKDSQQDSLNDDFIFKIVSSSTPLPFPSSPLLPASYRSLYGREKERKRKPKSKVMGHLYIKDKYNLIFQKITITCRE